MKQPTIATLLKRELEWSKDRRKRLYEEHGKALETMWSTKLKDRQMFVAGVHFESMSTWLLGAGRGNIAAGNADGWKQIAEGYQLKRMELLCEIWSVAFAPSRRRNASRYDAASLMIFAWWIGDKKFEKFCERILLGSFPEGLIRQAGETADFIACIAAKKAQKREASIRKHSYLHPTHEALLDAWDTRKFKDKLIGVIDYRGHLATTGGDFTDAFNTNHGLLTNAPIEIPWLLDVRKHLGQSIPRLKHWMLDDNPVLKLPKVGIHFEDNELVDETIGFFKDLSPKLASVFDLKAPKFVFRGKIRAASNP